MPVTSIETAFTFNDIDFSGALEFNTNGRIPTLMIHDPEGPEVLSVNLDMYALVPRPGCVFIKNWSEHSGLATCLQAAGLVRITRTVEIQPLGPDGHTVVAYEVRVL